MSSVVVATADGGLGCTDHALAETVAVVDSVADTVAADTVVADAVVAVVADTVVADIVAVAVDFASHILFAACTAASPGDSFAASL